MDICYIFFVVNFQIYTSLFWCSCVLDTLTQFYAPLIHPVMWYFLQGTKLNCHYINLKGFYYSSSHCVLLVCYLPLLCLLSASSVFPDKLTNLFFLPPVPEGKPWDTVILYACLLLNELQVENKRNNFVPYPHMCKNAAGGRGIQPFSLR